jgi:hypothetical protein
LFDKIQVIADQNMIDLDDTDFDWIRVVEEKARKSQLERIEKER